ncbi:unnamed protein product [Sympodiomycopsis kandeliae]
MHEPKCCACDACPLEVLISLTSTTSSCLSLGTMTIEMTTLLTSPPFPSSQHVDRSSQKHLKAMYMSLQRGQLKNSTSVALATAKAMRSVISGARYNTMDELIQTIKSTGNWLQEARKGEQSISSITLRILHLLSEEAGASLESVPGTHNKSFSSSSMSTEPGTPSNVQSLSYLGVAPSATATTTTVSSPLSSPPVAAAVSRPPLRPSMPSRMDSNFFAHDSTFSISDLVVAGQNANSNSYGSGFNSALASGFNTPGISRRQSHDQSGQMQENEAEQQQQQQIEEEEESDESESESESDSGECTDGQGQMEASTSSLPRRGPTAQNAFHLKPLLIQAVQELIEEIENTRTNIARDAKDHIHSGEIVLTLGHSLTVETFLKQAARDRSFTLIVADDGGSQAATAYSETLSKKRIKLLSIPSSSIFTILPRVTKVLLSTHCILPNGGLLSRPSSAFLCQASKIHSTPVIILSGLHKVCSDWKSINNNNNDRIEAGDKSSNLIKTDDRVLEVISTEWDYIEPHLVDVLVTNTGEYPASYVYRLIAENFAQQ